MMFYCTHAYISTCVRIDMSIWHSERMRTSNHAHVHDFMHVNVFCHTSFSILCVMSFSPLLSSPLLCFPSPSPCPCSSSFVLCMCLCVHCVYFMCIPPGKFFLLNQLVASTAETGGMQSKHILKHIHTQYNTIQYNTQHTHSMHTTYTQHPHRTTRSMWWTCECGRSCAHDHPGTIQYAAACAWVFVRVHHRHAVCWCVLCVLCVRSFSVLSRSYRSTRDRRSASIHLTPMCCQEWRCTSWYHITIHRYTW